MLRQYHHTHTSCRCNLWGECLKQGTDWKKMVLIIQSNLLIIRSIMTDIMYDVARRNAGIQIRLWTHKTQIECRLWVFWRKTMVLYGGSTGIPRRGLTHLVSMLSRSGSAICCCPEASRASTRIGRARAPFHAIFSQNIATLLWRNERTWRKVKSTCQIIYNIYIYIYIQHTPRMVYAVYALMPFVVAWVIVDLSHILQGYFTGNGGNLTTVPLAVRVKLPRGRWEHKSYRRRSRWCTDKTTK